MNLLSWVGCVMGGWGHHTLSVVRRLTICVAIVLLDCASDGGSVTEKVVRVVVGVRVMVKARLAVRVIVRAKVMISVKAVVRVTVRVRVVVQVTARIEVVVRVVVRARATKEEKMTHQYVMKRQRRASVQTGQSHQTVQAKGMKWTFRDSYYETDAQPSQMAAP